MNRRRSRSTRQSGKLAARTAAAALIGATLAASAQAGTEGWIAANHLAGFYDSSGHPLDVNNDGHADLELNAYLGQAILPLTVEGVSSELFTGVSTAPSINGESMTHFNSTAEILNYNGVRVTVGADLAFFNDNTGFAGFTFWAPTPPPGAGKAQNAAPPAGMRMIGYIELDTGPGGVTIRSAGYQPEAPVAVEGSTWSAIKNLIGD
jgi:hypothetical protein